MNADGGKRHRITNKLDDPNGIVWAP